MMKTSTIFIMKGATFLLIASLTLTGLANQPQQDGELQDPPWLKELLPKRIVYTVPGMEQVRVRKDLTYKRAADAELKMDVYTPTDLQSGARRPAVIFIHGGYLPPNLRTKPKDWGVYVSYGQLLAASGFIAVTFNHRFYGWDRLGDAQSDVTDLIAYVRNNADSLNVDKDRLSLWAFSGGGPFLSQAVRDAPPYVRCVVSYYAILDLQPLRKEIPAAVADEALREFSPFYHLGRKGKEVPPVFIARAGLDRPELNNTIDRFVQEALAKNVTIDLSNHPSGRHAFDILDDNDRSREIIKRTVDFIRAHN
ncbi:MAG TPA: alpha/beta hydrolase [Blastocatellia bacterium]|nr:alpha/beta hydrolase [Blastocatellia bacterium]